MSHDTNLAVLAERHAIEVLKASMGTQDGDPERNPGTHVPQPGNASATNA